MGEAWHGLVFDLEEILCLSNCGSSVWIIHISAGRFIDYALLEVIITLVLIKEGDFGSEYEAKAIGCSRVLTLASGRVATIFGQIDKKDSISCFPAGDELCASITDECVPNLRAEQSLRLGREAIVRDRLNVDRFEGQFDWVTQLVRITAADEGQGKQG